MLGDFNAHIEENKVGQKWNKRGTKLQSMCNKLKLVPVNLSPLCDSPQLTYLSRTGNSIIDYIILDKDLVQFMESVQVLNEHPDNVAYHLPLTIKLCTTITENFERSKNEVNQDYMHENICWKKCSADKLNIYNYNLSTSVSEILNDDLNDVNNLYDELWNAIKSADVVLPRVKYRKHVKPAAHESNLLS